MIWIAIQIISYTQETIIIYRWKLDNNEETSLIYKMVTILWVQRNLHTVKCLSHV